MELKKTAKYVVLGIVLIIAVAFVGMGFITYDVMSYTATSSEILNPTGNMVGNALVVYDPSVTGAAKNAASVIASDLQAKGYKVNLAGIRSTEAATTSGYDVIVISGPIYAGNLSSAAQSYLNTLKPSENTKIGIFTTGGVNNTAVVQKEITLPSGGTIKIDDVMKLVNGEDVNQKAAAFVDALLK